LVALWHGLVHVLGVVMLFFSVRTGSYGVGIILLTILIRLLLFPLYRSQLQSMKRMQEVQPQLQRLQERYKNDRERLASEQMKLYRDQKINPMASCLPMLLQLPLLYALYGMLEHFQWHGHPPLGAGFLWLPDLGHKDPYLILPILGGVSTYWQTKISMALQPATGQQQMQMMTYMMPLVMFYVFWRLPSGLAVYWVVANVITIAQQYLTVGALNGGPKGGRGGGG
jgi:YidC/Oxa1 family membrane protein insertase